MPISKIDQFLWLAGFIGHVLLLAIVFIRSRAKGLPLFTTLLAANVLRTVVLFGVYREGSRRQYFVTYWSLALIDLLLQCGFVYEMAYRIFRPGGVWATDLKRGWMILLAGASIISILFTVLATAEYRTMEEAFVIKVTFFSSVLMAQILVGMVVLSVSGGLPLNTYTARIAIAFGIYSTVDVIIGAAHALFGSSYQASLDLTFFRFRGFTYLLCLLVWGISLWQRLPARPTMSPQLDSFLRSVASLFPSQRRRQT